MYVSQSTRPPATDTAATPLPVLVETKQWLATRTSPRVATSQRRTSWQPRRYSRVADLGPGDADGGDRADHGPLARGRPGGGRNDRQNDEEHEEPLHA